MKYLFICSFCLLVACTKDKIGNLPAINSIPTPSTTPVQQGNFVPTSGITVNGSAKIVQSTTETYVLLDSFSINAGPDLKVYLSTNNYPNNFANLGALKSNTGNSTYTIPAAVNVQQYSYVLIHCQQYNHLFAFAKIK